MANLRDETRDEMSKGIIAHPQPNFVKVKVGLGSCQPQLQLQGQVLKSPVYSLSTTTRRLSIYSDLSSTAKYKLPFRSTTVLQLNTNIYDTIAKWFIVITYSESEYQFSSSVLNFYSSTDSSEVKCLAWVQRVTGSSPGPWLCKNLTPGRRKGSQSGLVKKECTS